MRLPVWQLCRAEAIKIVGHRWAFLLLLAIFPLTALACFLVLLLLVLADVPLKDNALFTD